MSQSRTIAFTGILASVLFGLAVTLEASPRDAEPTSWNAKAAEKYLDQRQAWWETWPRSARDHGTACLSCHTALPYALARPELTAALHENVVPSPQHRLEADVVTRVRAWSEVKPYYADTTPGGGTKAVQSRGTEAVINALVLAARDSRTGIVSADARQAFENMFALQQRTGDDAGAWAWLDFGLRPWESKTSVYFGAAMAAIAVGLEPQGYADGVEIRTNRDLLRRYLRTHLDQTLWNRLRRRDDPFLFNRAMLLWASSRLPDLVSRDERQSMIGALWAAQDGDGAWRLSSLGRWGATGSVHPESTGDGLATGLVAYALEQVGIEPNEPRLAHALQWLERHQDETTGMWSASSLNKRRDPTTNVGKFMSDAATAYAVLALTKAQQQSLTERIGRHSEAAGPHSP